MEKPCLCKNIPPKQIDAIRKAEPDRQKVERLGDFFKVFGDPTRLRLLYYLARNEFCVADLSSLVGMQQSAVSHQLKILRLHRLVRFRKEGATTYYALDDRHVQEVFDLALEHICEAESR